MPSSCIFVMLSSDNKNQIRSKVCYPLFSPSTSPSLPSSPGKQHTRSVLPSIRTRILQPTLQTTSGGFLERRERFIVHFASFWARFVHYWSSSSGSYLGLRLLLIVVQFSYLYPAIPLLYTADLFFERGE